MLSVAYTVSTKKKAKIFVVNKDFIIFDVKYDQLIPTPKMCAKWRFWSLQ